VYRTFLDQAVFSPRKCLFDYQTSAWYSYNSIAMIMLFFTSMSIMEGQGLAGAQRKLKEVSRPSVLAFMKATHPR
jgi:hypothetical protein